MNNDFLLNLRLSNLERQLNNLAKIVCDNNSALSPEIEKPTKCEVLGVRLNKVGGVWLSDGILNAEPHLGDGEHYVGICPKFSKYLMYVTIKNKTNGGYKRYLATHETTVIKNEIIPLIADNKTCLEITNLVDCKDFTPASIRLEFCHNRNIKDDEAKSFINGLIDYFKTKSIESSSSLNKFFEDDENKDVDRFKTMAISINTDSIEVDIFSGIYKEDTIEDLKHEFCLECKQTMDVSEKKE